LNGHSGIGEQPPEMRRADRDAVLSEVLGQPAITHLAEENVGLALLTASARHTSMRSLQRYARLLVALGGSRTSARRRSTQTVGCRETLSLTS
jgi:hypothetical protein